MKITYKKVFATAVSAAVLVVVIAGLIVAGSPNQERMRRADQERVSDLQAISAATQAYMYTNNALPPSLADLMRSPDVYLQRVNDPETGVPYRYTPGVDGRYELCATFQTASDSGPDKPPIPQPAGFWAHGAGERCYQLEAKPDTNNLNKMIPPPEVLLSH